MSSGRFRWMEDDEIRWEETPRENKPESSGFWDAFNELEESYLENPLNDEDGSPEDESPNVIKVIGWRLDDNLDVHPLMG